MDDQVPPTPRRHLVHVVWLVAATAGGLIVVAAMTPRSDPRGPALVLLLPVLVGGLASLAGRERRLRERVARGVVAAAWTATGILVALLSYVVFIVALLTMLSGEV